VALIALLYPVLQHPEQRSRGQSRCLTPWSSPGTSRPRTAIKGSDPESDPLILGVW